MTDNLDLDKDNQDPDPNEGVSDFFKGLDSEYQTDPTIQLFKNADGNTIAKTLINQQKMVGSDKLAIPDWNDNEQAGNFFQKIGRPETADKYVFKDMDNVAKSEIDVNKFKETVFARNLTTKQAEGLLEDLSTDLVNADTRWKEEQATKAGKAEEDLRSLWGSSYADREAMADKVIDTFTPEANRQAMKDRMGDALGKQFMAEIGKQFSENKIGNFNRREMNMNPSEAQEKVDEIYASRGTQTQHAYWNPDNAIRQTGIKEVEMLMTIANSGAK